MCQALTLAALAQLISGPARLKMLVALQTAGELTASELAVAAGVSPQAASAHLAKLCNGGLIVRSDGYYGARQRVFRLANPEVTSAVRAVAALAATEPPRDPMQADTGRRCYDHLGGPFGYTLLEALLAHGVLEPRTSSFGTIRDYQVTTAGTGVLVKLGLDLTSLTGQRRELAKRCLNAPEAASHLAGSLGQALALSFLQRGWIVLSEGRSYALTPTGRAALDNHLALRL